jgi:hypothetical protein
MKKITKLAEKAEILKDSEMKLVSGGVAYGITSLSTSSNLVVDEGGGGGGSSTTCPAQSSLCSGNCTTSVGTPGRCGKKEINGATLCACYEN